MTLPWPLSGSLDLSRTALVVIDMQTDFCGPNGWIDRLGQSIANTRKPIEPIARLLEAARGAGLNPLSSCEEGFCASCAAKRIKGKVVLAKNDIYTADDLANDWILTCQGHCFGPEVEITYDVV